MRLPWNIESINLPKCPPEGPNFRKCATGGDCFLRIFTDLKLTVRNLEIGGWKMYQLSSPSEIVPLFRGTC